MRLSLRNFRGRSNGLSRVKLQTWFQFGIQEGQPSLEMTARVGNSTLKSRDKRPNFGPSTSMIVKLSILSNRFQSSLNRMAESKISPKKDKARIYFFFYNPSRAAYIYTKCTARSVGIGLSGWATYQQ